MREEKVGRYIAEKRKAMGLTQAELGDKLGFSDKAVSKWERGLCFPDVDTLHALAGILLCKVENLINGSDDWQYSSDISTREHFEGSRENGPQKDYTVDLADRGYAVLPNLFGANIEHTRSAVFGGLSAQLLRNRKFAGMPTKQGTAFEWFSFGDKCYSMLGNAVVEGRSDHTVDSVGSYTRHSGAGYHMRRRYECNSWQVQNFGSLAGFGQEKLNLIAGKEYEFRIVLHTDDEVNLKIELTSHGGKTVYASGSILANSRDYETYRVNITSSADDGDGELRVSFKENTRIVIGAMSLMPTDNFHGMRRDIIQSIKDMKIKYLRWPGGNFAGEYNWLDGLLDIDMRAPFESHIALLTQPHTHGYECGDINTDDFIALCREVGAEPSITLNTTWNTPEENAAWVEYCNGDENTEYGKLRISRGFAEPYNVKYWSLGNEAGYGHMEGDNSPEGYYVIAKNNAEALLKKDKGLVLCSSGFQPDEKWTTAANNKLKGQAAWTALHNYVDFPNYTDKKCKKTEYLNALSGVDKNQNKIQILGRLLDSSISVAFDEWNCWYSWHRPSDVFSGIFAAEMLTMFIGEQKKSRLVCGAVFQAINEGCIAVTGNSSTLTPMGKAFSYIAEHSEGRVLHISKCVAATVKEDTLTVTLINDSYDDSKTFSIEGAGSFVSGSRLTGDDIGPFTEFCEQEISLKDNTVTLPPLSIALLKLKR